eukprot:COSAG04_NODE_4853_length_1861_cov_1.028377_3_plen_131_part_00
MGPILGGLLARPAELYPAAFAADGPWGRFPYLLPCFVVAITGVLAMVATQLWLPPDARTWGQVLRGRRGRYRKLDAEDADDDDDDEEEEEPASEEKARQGVLAIYAGILRRRDARLAIVGQVLLIAFHSM